MLVRLRSFLKRSKSSSSVSNGTVNAKVSSISTVESDLDSTSHSYTHTTTLPNTNANSNNNTATPTSLPSPTDTSSAEEQTRLLPSPLITEPAHVYKNLNLTVDTPIAKEDSNTNTPSHSSLSTPPPSLPATDFAQLEKDVYIHEEELSKASSEQLPWLSPASKHPVQDRSRSASPASLSARSSVPSLFYDDGLEIMQRKIWVRRPGASATLVTVNDDDLVDTVRDMILRKYANSLGKSIDSPDITLKIISREQANKNIPVERTLGPEESIGRTLDLYYAGGQTIDEALVIDIPRARTPKPSPRVGNHHPIPYPYFIDEQHRPSEAAREYFPPMAVHSPHIGSHPQHPQHPGQPNGPHIPHSMSILATGQIPPLASPGGHSSRRRPKYIRQHTSSPTIMHSHQPTSNGRTGPISTFKGTTDHSLDLKPPVPKNLNPPAPLPTPPAQSDHRPSITPPNRPGSPHSGRPKRKKQGQSQQNTKGINGDPQTSAKPPAGLLDGNVPPINVLIVEDNVINLRLLEQFMRRLKVRWKSAMNGREAVNTWRTGGFHLVLMDIQLPVMSGLEATKEIRRLESVNGIGLGLVGSQDARGKRNGDRANISDEDKLDDMSLFKSPVIIVALTASSLQSDRHEALAVGCNDFLTKPVGYPWMLRKVTEWGCMQALIDFDGWRKWKAYAENEEKGLTPEQKKAKEKEERMKRKAELTKMFTRPPPKTLTPSAEKPKEGTSGGKNETEVNGIGNGTISSPVGSGRGLPLRGGPRRGSGSGAGSSGVLETHEEESEE